MALVDRISFDSSGMAADKLTAFKKGLAYYFAKKQNPDWQQGDALDISSPAGLNTLLKQKIASMLKQWSFDAQNYERDQAATPVDITDA